MIAPQDILDTLATIPDPEMPISIVDLGIVEDVRVSGDDRATVEIDILPTFVGCPALPMIESDIRAKVSALDGVTRVDVRFRFDPPWTVDRITADGRVQLAAHGVRVPDRCGSDHADAAGTGAPQAIPVTLQASALACPFCGSRETRLESPFGPTRCRTIWYCDGCRNAFEGLKRV